MSVSPIANAVPGLSSQTASGAPKAAGSVGASSASGVEPIVGAGPKPEAKPVAAARLHQVIDEANRQLQQESLNLQYSLDKDTKEMVVKLVDTHSGEVIRQIPSEELLAIAKQIDKVLASRSGFAIQTKA